MTLSAHLEDPFELRQRHVHRPEGTDQAQFRHHSGGEQPIAALRAAYGMDQTFIAIETHRFHGQTARLSHLTNPQSRSLHAQPSRRGNLRSA